MSNNTRLCFARRAPHALLCLPRAAHIVLLQAPRSRSLLRGFSARRERSAAPTCQEKSSCCGRWSCSAGAAKCFSPCSPNPCGAHGTCSITLTGGEKCVCKNAYTGAKCQITPGAPQAQHPPHRAAPSAHPTSAPQRALTRCLHAAARRLRGYICEHNCQPRWHIWHVLCRRHA